MGRQIQQPLRILSKSSFASYSIFSQQAKGCPAVVATNRMFMTFVALLLQDSAIDVNERWWSYRTMERPHMLFVCMWFAARSRASPTAFLYERPPFCMRDRVFVWVRERAQAWVPPRSRCKPKMWQISKFSVPAKTKQVRSTIDNSNWKIQFKTQDDDFSAVFAL